MDDWQNRAIQAIEQLRGRVEVQAVVTMAILRSLTPEQLADALTEMDAEQEAAMANMLGSQAGDAAIEAFRQDLAAIKALAPGRRRRA